MQVALAAHNVTPSDTRSYAAVNLLDAVFASYGASPILRCRPRKTLVELWMCLSLDLEPIPCPPHLTSTCSATVRLPERGTMRNPSAVTCDCDIHVPHASLVHTGIPGLKDS